FRVADLSDYSPPTSNRQSLFQCVAERARSISYHYPWRFRDGYRYPLGTLATDGGHYYGDNSRMVFPVEHFCYPLAQDGCLQHAYERSLHLFDVPEQYVLSSCGIARMVSNGGANQSDDLASRHVAFSRSGSGRPDSLVAGGGGFGWVRPGGFCLRRPSPRGWGIT